VQLAVGLGVVAIVGLAAVHHVQTTSQARPYHEFKQVLREGRVEDVQLSRDRVRWRERASGAAPAPGAAARVRTFEAVRVRDPRLVEQLEEKGVRYGAAPDTSSLTTLMMYVLAAIGALLLWNTFARRIANQAGGAVAFGKSRSKVFEESEVSVRFSDVAGVDEAKEELSEVVEFLRSPAKFTSIGARIPKGVLLVGPPGTGKTLLGRAVAGEAGVPFYSISGSEFVEMFVGVGAARVRDLFENAERHAPCIVFIDELDALGRSRGANVLGTNEEREQTLNQLLVEMDGFESNKGVIVLAATNRPEVLDPALLRPGRFDRQVLVDRPDRKGREAILRVHLRGVKVAVDVDADTVAARTPGFAGADLANVVNEAALLAARKGHGEVNMIDIEEAIERTSAGLERRSRIISPEERRRVAYHEVGHAIVSEAVPGGSRVAKVSIVPRGMAALGYTMKLPTEDRYLMTESELRAQLAGLLGGRVAEQLVFGEVSTGASDDLRRATELARAMASEYGMSDAIGPVAYARERGAFLGIPGESARSADVGERLTDTIDNEVKRIVLEAERTAREVLSTRRNALERIAQHLMEREYLDGDAIRSMLAESTPSM
jgi:cell division protease FtsH